MARTKHAGVTRGWRKCSKQKQRQFGKKDKEINAMVQVETDGNDRDKNQFGAKFGILFAK